MEAGTRDLIGRYNEAWNAHDLDEIVGLHTPDMVFHNHTAGERVEGSEQVRAHIAGIFERYPDLRFQERALNCAEDFAASEWTARATVSNGRVAEWDGGRCLLAARRPDCAKGRVLGLGQPPNRRIAKLSGLARTAACSPPGPRGSRASRR